MNRIITEISKLYEESHTLLFDYENGFVNWKNNKNRNEFLVDIGAKLVADRFFGKYARKAVKNPKWEDSQEYTQLNRRFANLKSRVTSQLNFCYSLSRTGIRGNNKSILDAFIKRMDKTKLSTKIQHLQDFLFVLKEEQLVDRNVWEDEMSKRVKKHSRKVDHGIYESFLIDVMQGNYPVLSSKLIEILIHPGETMWIEKKQKYKLKEEYQWIEFTKDLLAAANAYTPKHIGFIVGLIDKLGIFVSAKLPDEAEIRQRLESKVTPLIKFRILPLKFPNNSSGYVIVISPSNKLLSFKNNWKIDGKTLVEQGEVWVRKGSRKSKLSPNDALQYSVKKSKIIIN